MTLHEKNTSERGFNNAKNPKLRPKPVKNAKVTPPTNRSKSMHTSSTVAKQSKKYNKRIATPTINHSTTITGIQIPFKDMVFFMVKLSFAAIPAALIISAIWFMVIMFAGVFTAMV